MNANLTFSMILLLLVVLPGLSFSHFQFGFPLIREFWARSFNAFQEWKYRTHQNMEMLKFGKISSPGYPVNINIENRNKPFEYPINNQNVPSDLGNNDYYNYNDLSVRQEAPQNPNPTTSYHIRNTEEYRPSNSRDCLLPESPKGGYFELSCAKPCTKRPIDLIPENSVLTYTCEDNYILIGNTISICINWNWTTPPPSCLKCGTSIAHGKPLIVNGLDAKVSGVFPWHVGIYKRNASEYEQICGGTLISSNLVISAAHCFYDEVFNKLDTVTNYAVSAGKYYRDWNAKENYAQKSWVESIRTGSKYLGLRNNYVDDIALLKLETPFQLTTLVRPVCVDWNNLYEREQLQRGQSGKVVGWGKDITDKPTNNLQEIKLPYVPDRQCLSDVPVNFQGFLTHDKFCAGYLNGSSVCDGDSGGGLCFEKNGIWYLRGVVSVSSTSKVDSCDYNSYVGFTRISNFLDWIRRAYLNE